jgi:hypothetical protein
MGAIGKLTVINTLQAELVNYLTSNLDNKRLVIGEK